MNHKTQLLKKAMQSWWIRAERDRFQLGILGRTNSDGTVTVAADQQDFVWVTLDIGTLVQAYNVGNGAVDNRAGLPVRVRQDNGRLLIDGINTAGFAEGDSNAPGSVYSVNGAGPDSHGNVVNNLDDLGDVNATSPVSGSLIQYNDFDNLWSAVLPADLGLTLDDLNGVTVPSPTAEDLLAYHGGEWENVATIPTPLAATIHAATGKTTPVDADELGITDSASFNDLKKVTWANVKATLKTYFDTLYNLYVHPNHSGDVTSVGDGATTIGNDKVTFAKMQNIATDSLIGRDTASSGDPENILLNTTLSMDGSGNLQRAALSGDVSASAGSNTTAIGNDKVLTAMILDAQVTLAKMANLAQSTIIGRAAGAGTGVPTALSVAQVVAIINATLDHGGLAGLSDDDHAQYLALAGRAGSQVQNGGTAANEDLTLRGTAHATKTTSYVLLQDTGGNVGIGGATAPTHLLDIGAAATSLHTSTDDLAINNTAGATISAATAQGSGSPKRSGFVLIRSRGDFTTPTTVAADDSLGFIGFKGYDGAASQLPVLIEAFVDGAVSSGVVPGRASVITGSNGGTRTVRQTWFNDGKVQIGDLTSIGASVLGVKAGTSSNDAAVGGVLYADVAAHGSSGSGETTLSTYTLPANTLAVNGQDLFFEAYGSFVTTANSRFLKFYFGGTSITIASRVGAGAGTGFIRGRIVRTGAATQIIYYQLIDGAFVRVTATETLSGTIVIKTTGQSAIAGATNDVTSEYFKIWYNDANT